MRQYLAEVQVLEECLLGQRQAELLCPQETKDKTVICTQIDWLGQVKIIMKEDAYGIGETVRRQK